MSFQTEFAERAKQYLGEDLDEKIIKDGHLNQICYYLKDLKEEIGTVKNSNYSLFPSAHQSEFTIENILFKTNVNTENNSIEVIKIIDGETTPIDTIIVQGGELFAVDRNEKFTTELFESYLRETFGEKLGF
ncbi:MULTISPECIES: DUF3942 family protein [Bacillus]|uniref:DUF3942 family protein n=1 Tax=Bacillus TaxID=1386 RepID=UPI00124C8DAB|nr:DUF3942 family protein [Bacillus cereus]KAB2423900.1 DUF3942 domain-containing protein [Bacillus cereus]